MLAYVIYNKFESKRNYWFISELIKSFKSNGVELKLLIENEMILAIDGKPQIIYNSKQIEYPSFVINRTNNYFIARHFESMGVKVFNNSNVSHFANNKYLSYLKVSQVGVPVIKTYYMSKNEIEIITAFPIVIKSLDGKGGSEVYLCNNECELRECSNRIKSSCFIVQDLASDIGKDLRVYILGNKIYKAILRTAKNGFKSNYCLGNDASVYELKSQEIDLVNKVLSIENFDYVGIDFLFSNGGMVFNEIEDSVGARMLYDKTDLNVAYDLASYICSIV